MPSVSAGCAANSIFRSHCSASGASSPIIKPAQVLEVRQAFQEQDPFDQTVGMLHFVDGFLLLVRFELLQAPVAEHAGMQEILVDRGELVAEHLVQVLDDFLVAFHGAPARCR